ncbi:alpha/beta fold hydrolase [Streptomyces sp. NPDC006129]|uniref:thioesterase II family protein n=1 Tax=unclassified Streptomyces TaxID=2593676 RepID=UPI00331D37E7
MADPDAWFVVPRPRPDARHRMLLFPHAGGGANYYRAWAAHLPPHVELRIVQYPGREHRMAEPLVPDMATLAGAVADAVAGASGPALPTTFVGHSMGASVAYEVARLLEDDFGERLEHLVVSGRSAPGTPAGQASRTGSLTDEELRADLAGEGGTDPRLLDAPDVRAVILPIVRNDYRLLQRYTARPVPLRCDLTAVVGDADPSVPVHAARPWEQCTKGRFRLHVQPGGHFYFRTRLPDVVPLLTERP